MPQKYNRLGVGFLNFYNAEMLVIPHACPRLAPAAELAPVSRQRLRPRGRWRHDPELLEPSHVEPPRFART